MLQRVVDTTTDMISNTTNAQLSNPTLCTEWTVKDLINHMVSGATMFAISAEQGSVPDEELGKLMGSDNVGTDPQGAWDTASKRALTAFEAPGAMEKVVKLPFGEMPAGVALNIAIFDVATHSVDLAQATGQKVTDTELLEGALADRPADARSGAAPARHLRRRATVLRLGTRRRPPARVRGPQS